MDQDTAKAAGQLVLAIETVTARLPMATAVAEEKWPLVGMQFRAPATGASYPEGTMFEGLSLGPANEKDSTDASARVKEYIQSAIDALTAQLAAL